tara:strand:- start:614 stop:1012 length:399 start_codon:yes stop_codon:yes gene_type:complete
MAITADKLTKVFIKMRDTLHEMQKIAEEEQSELKAKMAQIEGMMLDICKSTGADSIKTGHGTIIRTIKTRYQTYDWLAMHEYIYKHKCFDLLERRIHQGNLKNWLQENPENIPEGLNEDSKYSVVVRKSKSK